MPKKIVVFSPQTAARLLEAAESIESTQMALDSINRFLESCGVAGSDAVESAYKADSTERAG